jgi:pimeloyl-ACP methyl ester carboxylesterase
MNNQTWSGWPIAPPPWFAADEAIAYWSDYWTDACQRTHLFLDVLRERSERYTAHNAKTAPHVLKFEAELLMDGRKLSRPVNYALTRIVPPRGTEVDDRKRPFVVVDPRAGHGPGIGGFKAASEIGVAMKAGHPCYFVGFLPEPVQGQTIEDIARAEAVFLEHVIARHPEAEGKPAVIGNCQAGWAIMMLAAIRPELFGPIIIAGSPLSYWAGVHGANPMRYTGGLLGGTWLAAMTSDLGNGKFDGAWLVANFENLNPSNTFWTKHYNLYSKVDTEGPRYLEFEEWWGGHVLLNAEEMQFIANELFVGNKLTAGGIVASDGTPIDLRNIRSPIIVFCSKADNITPPQQALGWILDLYQSVDEIRSHGQTIVYAVHETVGHLGIFVSGSVAKKEHDEFTSNIDLIDVLPPGLYEAVMTPKDSSSSGADMISGDYLVRFEARSLDDIRALGGNTEEDDRHFATAARVSEINLGLYRAFLQPWVRGFATQSTAEWMRKLHPLRLQYEMFGSGNPFLRGFRGNSNQANTNRKLVPADNPLWQAQEQASEFIKASLDAYRDVRDRMCEATFHAMYGSPMLQALVGLKASDRPVRARPGENALRRSMVSQRIAELKRAIPHGGPREALLRALLYIRMPDAAVDERVFNFLHRMREETGKGISLEAFKRAVREQFFMLLLDERRCIEAIPEMLATDPKLATRFAGRLRSLVELVGLDNPEVEARLAEIESLIESHGVREPAEPGEPAETHRRRPPRETHIPSHKH